MTTNEGQPSGPNPEWEIDKTQNIAIAKRIDDLLLESPSYSDFLLVSQRQLRERLENFPSQDPELKEEENRFLEFLAQNPDISAGVVDDAVIRELTVENISTLTHVENVGKHIFIGVSYSKDALQGESDIGTYTYNLLPQRFKLPVYIITDGTHDIRGEYSEFHDIDVHEEFPSDNTENDNTWYSFRNVYCFNIYGQGIKMEIITKRGPGWRWLRSLAPIIGQPPKTDVPEFPQGEEDFRDEVHLRVASITLKDYDKINKMFDDIDTGLYQVPKL